MVAFYKPDDVAVKEVVRFWKSYELKAAVRGTFHFKLLIRNFMRRQSTKSLCYSRQQQHSGWSGNSLRVRMGRNVGCGLTFSAFHCESKEGIQRGASQCRIQDMNNTKAKGRLFHRSRSLMASIRAWGQQNENSTDLQKVHSPTNTPSAFGLIRKARVKCIDVWHERKPTLQKVFRRTLWAERAPVLNTAPCSASNGRKGGMATAGTNSKRRSYALTSQSGWNRYPRHALSSGFL